MKTINIHKISLWVILGCMALSLAGCSKKYEWPYELRLTSRHIEISKDAVTTPVVVYSNTTWMARMEENASWVRIDRTSGKGIDNVYLTCDANQGLARTAKIVFWTENETETLTVHQAARITDPELTFTPDSFSLLSNASLQTATVATNLTAGDLKAVSISVSYADEENAGWLSGVTLNSAQLSFRVAENNSGSPRTATIIIRHSDNDAVATLAQVTVSQSTSIPKN